MLCIGWIIDWFWDKILLTIWESWSTLCWTWTCQSGFERGSVWCETVDGWVLFWDEREMRDRVRPRLEWALSDSFNKYQAVTPSIISPAWPGWQVASKYWSWVWGYSGTRLSGRDINLILGGAITPSMGITLLPRYNAQIIRDKGGAGIFDTRATPARARRGPLPQHCSHSAQAQTPPQYKCPRPFVRTPCLILGIIATQHHNLNDTQGFQSTQKMT